MDYGKGIKTNFASTVSCLEYNHIINVMEMFRAVCVTRISYVDFTCWTTGITELLCRLVPFFSQPYIHKIII